MTPEEIQAMAKGMAEGQALWYLLSAVIGGAIAGLGGYLAEKGKNRATKEDIATITREVEQVRAEFTNGVEDLKAHHQLRMVAAERRIQAHQEAYTLIDELRSCIKYSEESWKPLAKNANSWHRRNYLYMGKETRNRFARALHGFESFRGQMHWMERDAYERSEEQYGVDRARLKQIWDEEIDQVYETIAAEVELPPLAMSEVMPSPSRGR